MGRVREQASGAILQAYCGRQETLAVGDETLESDDRRDRGNSRCDSGGVMTLWARVRSWTRAMLGRDRMEREMDEEMRFHMEARAADLERCGIPQAQALRQARLEFGGMQITKEE